MKIPKKKFWFSEPSYLLDGGRVWQKSYSGDNRVVALESSYRRRGLLHRCRLFLSWACRSVQGWGCSPIKRDRELGSERCEAVCLISTRFVYCLRGRIFQYERNEEPTPLVYGSSDKVLPSSYALKDKCWKHLSTKLTSKRDMRTPTKDWFDRVGV